MKRKIKIALDAIDGIFSDTSVSQEATLNALGEVQDELEMKMDALRSDIAREERRREK